MSTPSAMVIGVGAQRGLGAALCRRYEKAASALKVHAKARARSARFRPQSVFLPLFFLQSERAIKEHWKSMG